MKKNTFNRRDFLKTTLASAVSVSPLMSLLGSLQTLEAATISGDYKALVVVLLEGGNDAFNMIVPKSDEAYDRYKAVRAGIELAKNGLLSLNVPQTYDDGIIYGMHPNMSEMQKLYNDQNLAIIANVGTLVEPVTKDDVEKQRKPLPQQLYAHNTQRALWMSAGNATAVTPTGWAARAGDQFYPAPNQFFNITVAGANHMQSGGIADAYPFRKETVSTDTITTYGFGPESGGGIVGKVYADLVIQDSTGENKLLRTFAGKRKNEIDLVDKLISSGFTDKVDDFTAFSGIVNPHPTGTPVEQQLQLVAKLLKKKDNFPGSPKRQIFFVNHHGWDTHSGQIATHGTLTKALSQSLGAFYETLTQLGLHNNVTTLTISDFGRSLTPNDSGTDHGWGGHAFVMGGAVKGGDIYGKMPQIKKDSPDATSNRVIPTTSVEQYLSPIVKWFGATEDELDKIFPNRAAFQNNGFWFMKS